LRFRSIGLMAHVTERSFKCKHDKGIGYLRSRMPQVRLNSLGILSIESQLLDDLFMIIETFTDNKARKKAF